MTKRKKKKYKHNVCYITKSFSYEDDGKKEKLYIGVKSFNNWNTFYKYQTSSHDEDFLNLPKMMHVIADFDTREEAMEMEILLHGFFDVKTNKEFANLCNANNTGFGMSGTNHSEETKRKISLANKGRKHSGESKIKMSEATKGEKHHSFGKTFSKEHRRKLSEAQKGEKHHLFGKTHSEESKKKMGRSRISIKPETVILLRELHSEGESYLGLSRRFEISYTAVRNAVKGIGAYGDIK